MTNSITQEQVEKIINDADYQEAIFWEKELVRSYKLTSGFTILGRAACVDSKNFVLEIGQQLAKKDAIRQLWELEGYLLQTRLHEQGVL